MDKSTQSTRTAELVALRNGLVNNRISLPIDRVFRGQSWGGAGVMVLSDDKQTLTDFQHCLGHDNVLFTRHAQGIGCLYKIIQKIVMANYFDKTELWGRATEAGIMATKLNPLISQKELALSIVDEVIRVTGDW